jgi:hypothetical protein
MPFTQKFFGFIGLWAILVTLPVPASGSVRGAIAETGWEWTNPKPQGNHLFAAVADNGVRVAVGKNGTIVATIDNVRWKVASGDAEYDLFDVIWANGLFVAVGGEYGFEFSADFGVVLTSSDGFNWVERHRTKNFMAMAVVWDGTRFVALGNGSRVLVSSDGINWSDETVELGDWKITDVVWDGSRYLAVGNPHLGVGSVFGSVFESEDAVFWQELSLECECRFKAIAWGYNTYVIVGYDSGGHSAAILVSTDAGIWDQVQVAEGGTLYDVIYGADGFTAVGDYGVVARSVDGHAWSFLETDTHGSLYGVADDGGGFLAVGNEGLTILSPDGSVWDVASSDSLDVNGSIEISEMAAGGNVVVGVGENSLIIRSVGGALWATNPSWGMGYYYSVNWIDSEFWAVALYGIAKSADGLDWELMLFDPQVRLRDIAWNGETYVAVGWIATPDSPEGGVSLVTTSTDGYDWTHQPIDAGGSINAVRWTGSRFVAVGDDGVHLTSPDGYAWTQHPRDETVYMFDMEWNGQTLVAVGSVLWHSDDGILWQESLPADLKVGGLRDVAWTGSQFVAVGYSIGDRIFTSADGADWSIETVGIGIHPSAVCGDKYSLHLAARGGKIIRKVLRRKPQQPRRPTRRVSPNSERPSRASVVR